MAELARVLCPGGTMAVTVPRCGPEFVNWALSDEYHNVPGGHVRIYRQSQLRGRLESTGLRFTGSHHAHGLHAPYWWLRCLVGPTNDDHPAVSTLPPAAGMGHRKGAQGHPLRRPGAQPAGGQEPGVHLEKPTEPEKQAAPVESAQASEAGGATGLHRVAEVAPGTDGPGDDADREAVA